MTPFLTDTYAPRVDSKHDTVIDLRALWSLQKRMAEL